MNNEVIAIFLAFYTIAALVWLVMLGIWWFNEDIYYDNRWYEWLFGTFVGGVVAVLVVVMSFAILVIKLVEFYLNILQ